MLTTDLKGHLALITGATGGIGSATCRALAPLGCSIAIHYNSATGIAQSLAEELRNQGVQAEVFQADLREYAGVRELHKQVVEKMGNPDILFNNAGITMQSFTKDITDVPIEMFEETWRANCGSAFLLSQLCVPAMAAGGWGRVIFCGSVAGFTGGIVGPHYASSKSALHGLIHWMAQVYGPQGITVNGVSPGPTDTPIFKSDRTEVVKKIPVRMMGEPNEIAETVLWLVKTGYMTNKVIGIDGGLYPY
ncbi:MAG: hypothetical protein LQ342_006332 [Letrouitia transgressa]|nr:MAG: hypothetical protein LQ342_006332 [Letrouitia transgressa]